VSHARKQRKRTLTLFRLLLAFSCVATFLLFLPEASAAPFNHSSTITGEFDTTNPLKLPIFIVLGTVTVLLFVGGFSGHQLLGVVGAVLLFFLSFMVLTGNLAIKDGEVSTVDTVTNTTTVEYQYEAWDYGNYRLVGFLMAILAVTMFTLFLAGGELG